LAIGQSQTTLGGLTSDRIGRFWQNGSHRRLKPEGWSSYTFAFHDSGEVSPGLLAQIAKKTGLTPKDL
jgi:hypothetical protein